MPKIVDLSGKRFGRLVVIEENGRAKNGAKIWRCVCDCGNAHFVTTGNLLSGSTQSCGCYRKEYETDLQCKHGKSNTRLHGIWRGMKGRCYSPRNRSYKNYGGRGIVLCVEWEHNFMNFYSWAMQNGYDDTKSIDRIDVNGNYCPENCRWVDDDIQANNKRNNQKLTAFGETRTLSEWARITGIDRKTISDRISKLHWPVEEALSVKTRVSYDHRRNKEKCVNDRSD